MSLITGLGLLSIVFVVIFTASAYGGQQAGSGQSRRGSIVEAWINILIGFSINFVANMFLLPLVGAKFTMLENLWLGFIYTSISIIRSYAVRRFFNDRIHNFAARAAERLS